jgi:hypothetical protein
MRQGPVHLISLVGNLAPTENDRPVGPLSPTRWREPSFWTTWLSSKKRATDQTPVGCRQAHGPRRATPFRAAAAGMMQSRMRGPACASFLPRDYASHRTVLMFRRKIPLLNKEVGQRPLHASCSKVSRSCFASDLGICFIVSVSSAFCSAPQNELSSAVDSGMLSV